MANKEFKPNHDTTEQKSTEEVKQPVIDPSKIKQQYAQAPQQPPQMSEEEINQKRAEEERKLDMVLPYLEKQHRATTLEMQLTEMDVLLGRINPQQVPGILGQELQIRAMKAQTNWAALRMDQMEMIKRAEEERALLQKEKEELEKSNPTKDMEKEPDHKQG